jgi:hypothetical protein
MYLLLVSLFAGACGDGGDEGSPKKGLDPDTVLDLGLLSLTAYQQRMDCIDGEPQS